MDCSPQRCEGLQPSYGSTTFAGMLLTEVLSGFVVTDSCCDYSCLVFHDVAQQGLFWADSLEQLKILPVYTVVSILQFLKNA